ncbi:MAG: retropepsin-like aspartic protease [Planctomycetota bacterium]|nr:retropepsin-like aspartic protease [Planctomycetota bacterium]
MRWLLPVLLFLSSCGSTSTTLDAVQRAQLRRPAGLWPEAWAVRGTYLDGAGRGTFEDRFAGDGFTRVHRSSLPGGSGSIDGQAFLVPIDGLPRPASGRAAREAEVTAAVLSGRWVTAERIQLRTLGEQRFELGLEGEWVAELTLDPQSARPAMLEFPREVGGRRLSFGRWDSPHGFPVAHEIVLENAQGRVAVWRAREVSLGPVSLEPPPVPDDTTFTSAVTQVTARLSDTRLVAEVLCDGHPAGWWLVDSGAASSAIAPEIADALNWVPVGEATLVGAAGRANRGIRRSGQISIGGLTVSGLPLVEADEAYLSDQLGLRVRGVLGADVLARCVVELDFAAGRMWVLDPDEWRPPANAMRVTLDGSVPLIEASFAQPSGCAAGRHRLGRHPDLPRPHRAPPGSDARARGPADRPHSWHRR